MGMASHFPLPRNSFQVRKIMCNAGSPSVQLLAIKPVTRKKHPKECKYRNTEQNDDHCSLKSPEKWAHFHVAPKGEEESVLRRKHYLIIFVERTELVNAHAIFEKFKNTVKWLRITNKELEFRIFYFGVDPKVEPYNLASLVVDKNTATGKFQEQISKNTAIGKFKIDFNKDIEGAFLAEDAVKYRLEAANEDLGNKDGKMALGDNGRKPSMLTICQKSGKGIIYEFKVASIGKGNLRAYARKNIKGGKG